MSLKDVIMEIAEEMAKDAVGGNNEALSGYSKQLKIACKASGDSQPVQPISDLTIPPVPSSLSSIPFPTPFSSPEAQRAAMVEKFRAEFRKTKENESTEENYDGEFVEATGGPAHGSMTSVHPQMPIGCLIELTGAMYQLCIVDGTKRLEYHEAKTQELQQLRKPSQKKPTLHLG